MRNFPPGTHMLVGRTCVSSTVIRNSDLIPVISPEGDLERQATKAWMGFSICEGGEGDKRKAGKACRGIFSVWHAGLHCGGL